MRRLEAIVLGVGLVLVLGTTAQAALTYVDIFDPGDAYAAGTSGSADLAAGTATITASGRDIWDDRDGFGFLYKEFDATEEIDISCRVMGFLGGTVDWRKAGVMIRDTLDPRSVHGMTILRGGNNPNDWMQAPGDPQGGPTNRLIGAQWRETYGLGSGWDRRPGDVQGAWWVRVKKPAGSDLLEFYYQDGAPGIDPWGADGWIPVDNAPTHTITGLGGTDGKIRAGLCVTAHNTGEITTANFTEIRGFVFYPTYYWDMAGSGNYDQSPATQWLDQYGNPVGGPLYPNADWAAEISGTDADPVNIVTVDGALNDYEALALTVGKKGGLEIPAGNSLTVTNQARFSADSAGLTMLPGATLTADGGSINEAVLEGTVNGATFTINTSGPMTAGVVEYGPAVGTYTATFAKGGGGRLAVSDGDLTNVTVQVKDGTLALDNINPTLYGSEAARLSGGTLDVKAALAMQPQDDILTEWWFAGTFNDANVGHLVDVDDDPRSLLVQDNPAVARAMNVHTDFGDGDRISERGRLIFNNSMNDPWNPDQVGMMISGTLHVETGSQVEPGDYFFYALNSDNRSTAWIDLNQNGDLNLGAFPNPNEEIVSDTADGVWYVNNLTPVAQLGAIEGDFPVAFGFLEAGGGEFFQVKWWSGSAADLGAIGISDPWGADKDVFINDHMQWVDPSDPAQKGMWKGMVPVATHLEITLTVDAPGSGLNITGMAEDQPATIKELIMKNTGELATSMDGPFPTSIVFNKTTIAAGAGQIGFNPDIPTVPTGNEGIVNNAGGPVTVAVGGSSDLRLNLPPTSAGSLGGVTFKPTSGRLINELATGAMDLATVNLHGGTYAAQGEEVVLPDTLRMEGHQIYGRDRLNDSVLSLDHTPSILTRTPVGWTTLKQPLQFATGQWTPTIPELVRRHDGLEDDIQINFVGEFVAPEDGDYEFAFDLHDDRGWMWLDLDQDGVFQRSNSMGEDERLGWGLWDSGWNTSIVSLDKNEVYKYAFGCAEFGGGESFDMYIQTPSMSVRTLVNPASAGQAGFWRSVAYKGFVDSTPIKATKDSTLEAITAEMGVYPDVTLKDAILATTASKGGGIAINTKISPDTEDFAGVRPLVDTNITVTQPIQGPGDAIPVVFQKLGPADAVLDRAGATGLGSTTFENHEGRMLLKLGAGNPIADRPVVLKGGTLGLEGAAKVYTGLLHGTLQGNMNFAANPGQHGVDPLGPTNGNVGVDPPDNDWTQPDWRDNQTQVYTGEVKIGPSGVASFYENVDDITYLEIAGQVVLNNNQWDVPTAGTTTLAPGWHPFEVRFSNGGGGAGAWADAAMGFGHSPTDTGGSTSTADYTWAQNSSPTTADLFRVQGYDALTFNSEITVDGRVIGGIEERIYDGWFDPTEVRGEVETGILARTPDVLKPLTHQLHFQDDAAFNAEAGFNLQAAFGAAWISELTPDVAGNWQFGYDAADDNVSIWVDFDQDGVFETSGDLGNERIHERGCCGGGSGWANNLAEGETYKVLFAMNDTGGAGYFRNAWFEAAGGPRTFIDPTTLAQAGLWAAPWLGPTFTPTTIELRTHGQATLAKLVLKNGNVQIIGTALGATVNSVSVSADTGGAAGIIAHVPTLLTGTSGIDGNGMGATISLGGSDDITLNKDGTNMAGSTIKVISGRTVAQVPTGNSATAGSDPLENAALAFDGGTFRIETPATVLQGASVGPLSEYWFDGLTVTPQMFVGQPAAASDEYLGIDDAADATYTPANIKEEPGLGWQVAQAQYDSTFTLNGPLSYTADGDGSAKGNSDPAQTPGQNVVGFGVDASGQNYYMGYWTGTLTQPAGLPTNDVMVGTWSDDGSVWWLDLDQDGVFERDNSGGPIDGGGADELVVDNRGLHGRQVSTNTVSLAPGNYDIALAFYEQGGGDAMEARIALPYTPAWAPLAWADMDVLDPTAPPQTSVYPLGIDWTGETLIVDGGGVLDAPTVLDAKFGALQMVSGILTVTGPWQGMSFSAPSIEADDTTVGLDTQIATATMSNLAGKGHTNVLFEKRGFGDLVFMGQATDADGVTITSLEGNVISLAASNPIAGATIQIGGAGEIILSAEDKATPEPDPYVADYTANAVNVVADGTLTAGSGGIGEADVPVTVNLGTAGVKDFTLTSGTATLRTTDDYLLNVNGTMSGSGGFAVSDPDTVVNINGGGGAGDGTVTDGTVALGADLGVGEMDITGGVTDTGANKLVISQRMQVGEVNFGIAGGTFNARGANVFDQRTIELDSAGSTLTIEIPAAPVRGMVAHWALEEETAGVTPDETGTYDGTLMNGGAATGPGATIEATGLASDGVTVVNPPVGDKMLAFNWQVAEDGGYVDLPDGFANFDGGITVAAWVYTKSLSNWGRVVDFGNGAGVDNVVLARRDTSNNLRWEFFDTAGGGEIHDSDNVYPVDDWIHLVGTCDSTGVNQSTMTVYVDGAQQSQSGGRTVPRNVTRVNNYIGESGWGADDFWDGYMDDIYIYDRALSLAEIATLYGGGTGPSIVAAVESPETDVVVSENVTITSPSDEVVLGNATILGATELTLEDAVYVLEGDLTADDGAKITGSIEVGGNVDIGGSVGTLTVDGELVVAQATYLCELDSTGSDLIRQENLDEGIILGGAGDSSDLWLPAIGKVSPDCPDYVKMKILEIDEDSAGEVEGDFQTKPAQGDYLGYGVFMVSYQYQEGVTLTDYELTVFQALEGDTDGNADVHPSDLAKLVQNWAPAGTDKTWPQGNFDDYQDGNVDPSDLSALVQNWAPAGYDLCPEGAPPVGGSAAVPEPGTLMLSIIGLLGLLLWRRRLAAICHPR